MRAAGQDKSFQMFRSLFPTLLGVHLLVKRWAHCIVAPTPRADQVAYPFLGASVLPPSLFHLKEGGL